MKLYIAIGIACFCFSCSGSDYETLTIRGSDTEVNVVLQLAEAFMEEDDSVSIGVTGGGSGTGIAALINKKTDIANSSRAFLPAELELARQRGVDARPIVFAIDALTFVCHEDLPVDALSLDQVREIYTGRIRNWSAIVGAACDLPISLYGRQGNSGTFAYIQNEVLQDEYSLEMKQMNGTSQILESLKTDPAGIGYVGIGYVLNKSGEVMDGVKIIPVFLPAENRTVDPSDTVTIINGSYPVIRPLYQYVDGVPTGKLKAFLEYELSTEGQALISKNGYFPITQVYKEHNAALLHE